jgi:hypothetical protein
VPAGPGGADGRARVKVVRNADVHDVAR